MITMLTAVFAQTMSSAPAIHATEDPSVGSSFAVRFVQTHPGRVHRVEIVDFGLEVSGQTKNGWPPTGTTPPEKLQFRTADQK